MDRTEDLSRLAGIVAERLAVLSDEALEGSPPNAELPDLLDALEFFVPQILRQNSRDWQRESLDGFLLAGANKSPEGSVSLVGLAILISDQTMTPFHIGLHPAPDGSLERAEVLLGERGGGHLGISGPLCTSAAVPSLLDGVMRRVSQVDWVYCATYINPDTPPSPDGLGRGEHR